jgi:hypothetical protein
MPVAAWRPAAGEYSQRQNEKDLAREAHHEVERDIFTIYTGTYPDPYDDYWTNTPWGKASGGGEVPVPPTPENWDDPPTGLTLKEGPPGFANISATIHADADGAALYVAEGPIGSDVQPVMPPTPAEGQVPLPYNLPINDEVRTWIWICAVKDGVLGQVTGPEWIERML